jgi:hypothetical protein
MKQIFNICDGDLDNHVYEVSRENLKRYYRDAAKTWGTLEKVDPISAYGTPIPGADMDEWPLDQIDHRLDREYDPQECLDYLEREE